MHIDYAQFWGYYTDFCGPEDLISTFFSSKTHPSKQYFTVAEKGRQPNIIIYEYPSLRPYRILRGRT